MATKRKAARFKVRQATAYRRLAAKALRNGRTSEASAYAATADRIMAQHHREMERKAQRDADAKASGSKWKTL